MSRRDRRSSRVGEGTAFRIYLPCVEAEMLPERSPSDRRGGGERGGETLLVVEDEPLVRSLIREILQESGYAVLEAANGVEALERVRHARTRPQLLVTDVVMPEMGGQELTTRMRAEQPELCVLYVSGYANDALSRSGVTSAATAYLPKPFDTATLCAKVRDLLDHVPA